MSSKLPSPETVELSGVDAPPPSRERLGGSPQIGVVELTEEDAEVLTKATRAVMRHRYVEEPEEWVAEAQLQSAGLSRELRAEFGRFRRYGSDLGALLVRGLPIGAIPDTPMHADNALGPKLTGTAITSVLTALLGEQLSFKPELGGKLFQSILPERSAERSQRSVGSKVYLEDHIEMCFLEARADYVILTCLRADHEAEAGTTFAPISRILPLLDSATVQTLRQPIFRTTVDESFLIGWGESKNIWVDPICVLGGAADRPHMRVDFAETEGKTPAARQALAALREAVQQVRVVVRLSAGDMIATDNVFAMHGRTPFVPRYDGRDRWLLRTFAARDLARSLEVRPGNGRVVDPDYSLWGR